MDEHYIDDLQITDFLLCRWTYNDALRAKYNAKMAGMSAPIAKPKGSKKLKDWETRWTFWLPKGLANAEQALSEEFQFFISSLDLCLLFAFMQL